jgi:hypothetical protein
MAYILTRVDKGTPLTYHEVDSNFTNLNDGKLERAAISGVTGTITSSATTSTITSVSVDTLAVGMVLVKTAGTGALGTASVISDVDPTNNTITVVGSTSHTAGSVTFTARPALSGGYIDGTPIGATSASTGAFTDVTISGDLTVNGTTTNINTTNLVIEDKNVILGDVTTPSNTTADGGGITLKGLTDKTLNWVNSTSAWTSSEDFNLLTGKVYEINGTTVLSGSTLGSGVTASSLTSVGTIATGTWSATTIAVDKGGTGQTTYTNGQLLIGNTTGNTLAKATLTGTTDQITVTNGAGSITLSTPQSIGTASSVQFGSLGIGTAASGTTGEIRATNNITAYYSSDSRLKENVRDIPNALDKVAAIGGKLFDWTDEYVANHGGLDNYFMRKADFGVIAQDVEQVLPEAVRAREDGYLAVDYEKLCALAFAAIKELQQQVEELKNR